MSKIHDFQKGEGGYVTCGTFQNRRKNSCPQKKISQAKTYSKEYIKGPQVR